MSECVSASNADTARLAVTISSFAMTSSTNQHRSTPDGHGDEALSADLTQYNANINGEVSLVTQLVDFKGKERSEDQDPFVPVHNLPNELLSYIFTLGSEVERRGDDDDDSDEEEEEEDATSEHGPHFPFQVLVSHVCQRWRVVAIETPTLWTGLDFSEGPPFEKSRTWLERSKECPLDIELDCTVEPEPESESESDASEDQAGPASENEHFAPQMPGGPPLPPLRGKAITKLSSHISPTDLPVVRDLILPHSARWRVFEHMVDDFQIMYGILSALASIPEAPELRTLRLYHHEENEDNDHFMPAPLREPFFAPFCGRAPGLGKVTLWGVHVDWEACAFLQGLEELELAYHTKDVRPPYDTFIRILRGSPDLRNLTLSASGPAGNPDVDHWPADVIELPSVRKLTLAFVEPSYASALMKRLVFPNLQVLTLDFDPDDYSPLIAQLTKPAPNQRYSLCENLVELKLLGMHCSDSALYSLYFGLPNVLKLELNFHHLDHKFLGGLIAMEILEDGPKDYALPKLNFLKTSGVSGVRMRHLLTLRQSIKHVRMESKDDLKIEDLVWLPANTESFHLFDGSDDDDVDEDEDEDDEDE